MTWRWSRHADVDGSSGAEREEVWTVRKHREEGRRYRLTVRYGKSTDLVALKRPVVSAFGAHVAQIRESRRRAFAASRLERVASCPICGVSTQQSQPHLTVYGGTYHQCVSCRHCFIIERPAQGALEEFYATNTHFAATYTDPTAAQTRVEQVATPKVEWCLNLFRRLYGRRPARVLDVGAGGGHFVHACRQAGIPADGVEASRDARDFARATFGIELQAGGLQEAERAAGAQPVELITFWNVLEHVSDPRRLLRAATSLLRGRRALVVAETPRWNSLSTAIQAGFRDTVVRHLDPLAHIQFFTDSSLATAFVVSGLRPVAAWYFGMDVYELMTQLSHASGGNGSLAIESLLRRLETLQRAVDESRGSDGLVLAGRPAQGGR